MSLVRKQVPFILSGRDRCTSITFPVINPYDNLTLYNISAAGTDDLNAAVKSAVSARDIMKKIPLYQRALILRSAADFLIRHQSDVIDSIVKEAGKPLRYAQVEFERCLDNLQLCSEQIKHLNGEMLNMDVSPAGLGRKGYWIREPIGIVLAITPFNFPLNLVAHKVAPALAAACPVIIKPASKTPKGALWLSNAFLEAGLPPEAISCLTGSGDSVASPLVQRPEIAKVTFTGSYEVGLKIARMADFKKTTFELGSNSAAIVDEELIDFDYAVRRLCLGSFYYQGQVCISVQRIFVHQALFDRFSTAFISAAAALVIGDPADAATEIGPMINSSEAERVKSWIDLSVTNGAKLLYGGKKNGAFIQPTVLSSVNPADPLASQEAFGPVVIVEPVKNAEEGIKRANESRFGLQASIFTNRIDVAEKAINELDVGGVIINDFPSFRLDHMPYGGVKDSGIGREGTRFAIEEMSRIKMVVVNNAAY